MTQRSRALLGLAGLVVAANLVWLIGQLGIGAFEEGYPLVATFDRVGQGLDTFSDVRIRGVRVGEVDEITFDEDGRAVVTMKMDPGTQVPTSTVAAVEPLSVFGPKFIRLEPGDGEGVGPYLEPGSEVAETIAPRELSDILVEASAVLGAIDQEDAFTLLQTITEALDGQGQRIGRTIDNGEQVVGTLQATSPQAEQLLGDLARLATTFRDRGDELVALAEDARTVLPDYTDRSEELGALLEDVADAAHQLDGLVGRHGDDLDTIVAGLDRASAVLLANNSELPAFLDALTAFFDGLGEITALVERDGTHAGAVEFVGAESACTLLVGVGCEDAP